MENNAVPGSLPLNGEPKTCKKWLLVNKRTQKYRERVFGHSYEHHSVVPPIRVIFAIVSRWGPGDFYAQLNRQVVSFNLVTRGNMVFQQASRCGAVSPGELFIAHKGMGQRFATGDAGFLHKRSIMVQGMGLDALMQVTGLTGVDRVSFENPAGITTLFRRCYRLLRDKPTGFASELFLLACAIINECCQSSAVKYPPPMRAAIEFMEQNLKENPPLPTIAAAAGLSVRNCIRLFRLHLHESPRSFFISLRTNAAKTMLMHSDLSVKQIGTEVGYDDPFHFSAQFKKRTGQSPSAFRASYRISHQSPHV
jgi:AraC family transcriptional regulator, arabinose operon regulatory protein